MMMMGFPSLKPPNMSGGRRGSIVCKFFDTVTNGL